MKKAEEKKYYISWYRLDSKDRYLIWCSTAWEDFYYVDNDKMIPIFKSINALQKYARENKIKIVAEEPLLHDLDYVERWSCRPRSSKVNWDEILAAWNLFMDLVNTKKRIGHAFNLLNDKNYKLYDRLAIFCINYHDTPYIYKFKISKKDVASLNELIKHGLDLFRANII